MNRSIVHIDLDSFFVSVERLQNPKLIGKPVLVGGSSDRGVVASCSYEARAFGIHSAMPMKMARQLCPDAIIVRGDSSQYSKFSNDITDIIKEVFRFTKKHPLTNFISTSVVWIVFWLLQNGNRITSKNNSRNRITNFICHVVQQNSFKSWNRRGKAKRTKRNSIWHRENIFSTTLHSKDPRCRRIKPINYSEAWV